MKKTTRKSRRNSAPSSTKNLASFIFSFLLSLTLVVVAVFFVANHSLSKKYVVSKIDSDYLRMLSENVYNAAVDYTMPTGVDVSVLDGVFTEDTIREDVKSYVMNAFDDNSYEVDTSKIYASLKENVDAFLREQGIDPTTEDKAVDEYVKAICNIYKDRVKLPGLNYLPRLSNLLRSYFIYVIIAAAIFALVNAFLCVKLHSYLHRGLRYVVYSLSGAALMTFVAPFVAYMNGFYKNLQISPNYFNHFIVTYIESIFGQLFIWAGVFLVLSIISLLVVSTLRKRIARKKKRH